MQQQERGIAQKLAGLTITTEAHMASLKLSDANVVSDTFKTLLDAAMGVEKVREKRREEKRREGA